MAKALQPTPAQVPAYRSRHRRNAQAWRDFQAKVEEAYETRIKWVEESLEGLTAAAAVMEGDGADAQAPNAITRTWQHAVFGYVYSVPELNACSMYYGNALSRCELVVGKRNADGSVEQGFDGDEPVDGLNVPLANEAAEIIARFRAPIGGQAELMRRYGELMFLVGELYFVPKDLPSGMVFEALSTLELKKEGSSWFRYNGPGYKDEKLGDDVRPIRCWRPAPNFSKTSSSSVRGALEILEELVVLTRLVRASAISKMALSGILAIPDELDFPEDEVGEDGDLSEATNPLATDMIMTGAKAIEDPASAAAYMPYILQGPGEWIDKIRHIPFQGDDNENVVKRREALERFAQGVDLPVEIVTGYESTTYANAFQVNEDRFTFHFQPALQILCDCLTSTVLWPALAAKRGIKPEDLESAPYPDDILEVAVTFDATKLISRPDRTKEMIEAFKTDQSQMGISLGELRQALGLDPDGGPDEIEVAARINAIRLIKERMTIQAPASDAPVPVADTDELDKPSSDPGSAKPQARSTAAKVADTQPTQEAIAASAVQRLSGLDVRIAGAAELAVERSLERVGAKLRSTVKGTEATKLKSVTNGRVARVLGPERTAALLGDEEVVLRTEATTFSRVVARWATEHGIDDSNAVAAQATRLMLSAIRHELYRTDGNGHHVTVAVDDVTEMLAGV